MIYEDDSRGFTNSESRESLERRQINTLYSVVGEDLIYDQGRNSKDHYEMTLGDMRKDTKDGLFGQSTYGPVMKPETTLLRDGWPPSSTSIPEALSSKQNRAGGTTTFTLHDRESDVILTQNTALASTDLRNEIDSMDHLRNLAALFRMGKESLAEYWVDSIIHDARGHAYAEADVRRTVEERRYQRECSQLGLLQLVTPCRDPGLYSTLLIWRGLYS